AISETYPDAKIVIYDRFGKKLIEYKGSDPGWDGVYNGQLMPTTDYWYEITVHEIDKVYTGHFTLLRR
ncbi:MAG: T9SS type B sorting domain-containing protein, partial [Paludibacteraceae bacterium]|nr:T9SS type B sorting domain-containing protein [Paludibacteraceae bacterium]